MKKLSIAILFGGNSSEYEVSLQSAHAVLSHISNEKIQPIAVGITRDGDWYYFDDDIEKIKDDSWYNEDLPCAIISPNQKDKSLIVFEKNGIKKLHLDAVFPLLHGKNGEDGTVQGLIELSGLPIIGCGSLSSAVCMDKNIAHSLAHCAGVKVPSSFVADKSTDINSIKLKAEQIGYPVFIKPLKAGSSFGISKILSSNDIEAALENAFKFDSTVIIEETIAGFEVGCAVMGNDTFFVGEIDEIELSGGFFDFDEKYTLKSSKIHVPARISKEKSDEIKEISKTIYKALNCSGFARVDSFLTPSGEIVFNEVNTIPGFTAHSRFPGMMKATGVSFERIIEMLINLAVR